MKFQRHPQRVLSPFDPLILADSSTNPTGQHNPSHQYSYGNYFSSSNQRRNKTIDFEVAKQYNQANGVKFQTDIRSNWDHDSHRQSSFSEDRPYLVNDVKIMLKSTNENISVREDLRLRMEAFLSDLISLFTVERSNLLLSTFARTASSSSTKRTVKLSEHFGWWGRMRRCDNT